MADAKIKLITTEPAQRTHAPPSSRTGPARRPELVHAPQRAATAGLPVQARTMTTLQQAVGNRRAGEAMAGAMRESAAVETPGLGSTSETRESTPGASSGVPAPEPADESLAGGSVPADVPEVAQAIDQVEPAAAPMVTGATPPVAAAPAREVIGATVTTGRITATESMPAYGPATETGTATDAGANKRATARAIDDQTSDATFRAFIESCPTRIARDMSTAGRTIASQARTDRRRFAAAAPAIEARLPGAGDAAMPGQTSVAAEVAMPDLAAVDPAAPVEGPSPDLEPRPRPQPPAKGKDISAITVSAGAAPRFRATGEANPARADAAQAVAVTQAGDAQGRAAAQIATNRAADKIRPVGVERAERIEVADSSVRAETSSSEDMIDYATCAVPNNARAIADRDFAPLLRRSLAGPRRKVTTAAVKRNRDQEAALSRGQAEADRASAEARAAQTQAIAEGRQRAEDEKRHGIAESEAKLAELEGRAEAGRADTLAKARGRIDTDQRRADDAIAEGERKARAKRTEGEKQAEAERRKAKEKKKKRKWWQKIGDFFSNIFKALARLVTKIFDAIKKAVDAILDAAKRLATGIINALRKAVIGLLKTFAGLLKTLVSTFFAFLPGLAKAVNQAIDSVVDAAVLVVNKVADALNETITSLIDKVQSAVNFILNAFESVLVGVLEMAAALVVGNFKGAALIMFKALCKAAGLPPEPLLEILENAAEALLDIIKHPVRFLGNLIKSVLGGFKKFGEGLLDKLLKGALGWLLGQVASAGISLPKTFSLKAIFQFFLQIMGFTFEYVRSRLVQNLGERNVMILETALKDLKILFTEGPAAFWEAIKSQAAQIRDAIIEAVSQWLITKIVVAATTKLASLFSPVSAVIQAVITLYNLVMFVIERAKQIIAFVAAISTSLKKIAVGDIATAIDWIDRSLTKAIPLLMSFLARLLGIGGIAEKLRAVVAKLRAPVNKIVDTIVKLVKTGARKAWGAAKRGVRSLRDRLRGRSDTAGRDPSRDEVETMTPEERVESARDYVAAKLQKPMEGDDIHAMLPRVQTMFKLKQIDVDRSERGKPKLAFKINPITILKLVGPEEMTQAEMKGKASSATTGAALKPTKAQKNAATVVGAINSQLKLNPAAALRVTDKSMDRPETVEATIKGPRRTGDREDNAITAKIGNLGDDEVRLLTGEGGKRYAGGHLIGDQMMPKGGPDTFTAWNLAPQAVDMNNPAYLNAVEFPITHGPVDKSGHADLDVGIKVTVTLTYGDSTYHVPLNHLIAGGFLSVQQLQTKGYDPTTEDPARTIEIPSRIPKMWQLEATVDDLNYAFPKKEITPGSVMEGKLRQKTQDLILGPKDRGLWTVEGVTVSLSGAAEIPSTQTLKYTSIQYVPPRSGGPGGVPPPASERKDPVRYSDANPLNKPIDEITRAELEAIDDIGPKLGVRIYTVIANAKGAGTLKNLTDISLLSTDGPFKVDGVGPGKLKALKNAGVLVPKPVWDEMARLHKDAQTDANSAAQAATDAQGFADDAGQAALNAQQAADDAQAAAVTDRNAFNALGTTVAIAQANYNHAQQIVLAATQTAHQAGQDAQRAHRDVQDELRRPSKKGTSVVGTAVPSPQYLASLNQAAQNADNAAQQANQVAHQAAQNAQLVFQHLQTVQQADQRAQASAAEFVRLKKPVQAIGQLSLQARGAAAETARHSAAAAGAAAEAARTSQGYHHVKAAADAATRALQAALKSKSEAGYALRTIQQL